MKLLWYQVVFHPNVLTMLRIMSLLPILLLHERGAEWRPCGLFVFGAILDIFDGYLARRWKLVTKLGKVLDPLADKVLIIPLLWVAERELDMSVFPFLALCAMSAIEALLLVVRLEWFRTHFSKFTTANPAANGFGKVKVWVQTIAVGSFLYDDLLYPIIPSIVCVAAVFAALSLAVRHPKVGAHPLVVRATSKPLVRWGTRFAAG
jgi:CDP-diacylglycerol--glycerol-3-phosphate 3-phosphatidyltransferase